MTQKKGSGSGLKMPGVKKPNSSKLSSVNSPTNPEPQKSDSLPLTAALDKRKQKATDARTMATSTKAKAYAPQESGVEDAEISAQRRIANSPKEARISFRDGRPYGFTLTFENGSSYTSNLPEVKAREINEPPIGEATEWSQCFSGYDHNDYWRLAFAQRNEK